MMTGVWYEDVHVVIGKNVQAGQRASVAVEDVPRLQAVVAALGRGVRVFRAGVAVLAGVRCCCDGEKGDRYWGAKHSGQLDVSA